MIQKHFSSLFEEGFSKARRHIDTAFSGAIDYADQITVATKLLRDTLTRVYDDIIRPQIDTYLISCVLFSFVLWLTFSRFHFVRYLLGQIMAFCANGVLFVFILHGCSLLMTGGGSLGGENPQLWY